MTKKGNAIVAQAGGPTAVINSSLYGVIRQAQRRNDIDKLFGAVHGVEGLLKEDLVDLFAEAQTNIDSLKKLPGAALGGCRHMIKSADPEDNEIQKIFSVFEKYKIRHFFYIGGNDSMDTASKIHEMAQKVGYDLRVIGIPKTIDNDLVGTDHCPGYGSCAKYLIASTLEAGIHAAGMATSEPVTILVTVGRNSGWLPAASCLAKKRPADAPHIVCFPEVPFDKEKFLAKVQETYRQIGNVFIVTGEGLKDHEGRYLGARFEQIAQDSFGHPELGSVAAALKELIERELKLKTRYIKPDICQQAAMHLASAVDRKEAELCGRYAVKLAGKGISGVMVALNRTQDRDYKISLGTVELTAVANKDRFLPRDFINGQGTFISDKFVDYLQPLIQGSVRVNLSEGIPVYSGLELIRVNPALKTSPTACPRL